jgi:hypothetical protein
MGARSLPRNLNFHRHGVAGNGDHHGGAVSAAESTDSVPRDASIRNDSATRRIDSGKSWGMVFPWRSPCTRGARRASGRGSSSQTFRGLLGASRRRDQHQADQGGNRKSGTGDGKAQGCNSSVRHPGTGKQRLRFTLHRKRETRRR